MPFYVIAGIEICPKFTHAVEIANYLQERLPNFEVYKIKKLTDDWNSWLLELNKSRGWHMYSSPVIWKEISMRGGHPYLIGGLSEFWEYVWDYYGLKSTLNKKDVQSILEHQTRLNEHKEQQQKGQQQQGQETNNIGITGVSNPMFPYLLDSLRKINNLINSNTVIRVYDNCMDTDQVKTDEIMDIIHEYQPLYHDGRKDNLIVVKNLDKVIKKCDLLLVLDEVPREAKDTDEQYMMKCNKVMSNLAERINTYAKRNIQIILSHHGLICFNATILMLRCTSIKLSNIVAVTSDLGLPYIAVTSERVNIPVKNMGGPPVWGFVGVNSYVDVKRMVTKAIVYKPYVRATKDIRDSTLSNGVVLEELRMASSFITDEIGIIKEVEKRKQKIISGLDRKPLLAKLRATIHLLTTWFAPNATDEVISVGILTDGTFGLPPGIVFSQPSKLNKRNVWKPYDIPVPDYILKRIVNLATQAQRLMKKQVVLTPTNPVPNLDNDDDVPIGKAALIKPSSKIKSFLEK